MYQVSTRQRYVAPAPLQSIAPKVWEAMARFAELIATPNLRIYDSGERDNTQTHRRLVWMILPDGRSVGQTLIDEGLAVVWTPDYRANWCK